MKTSLLLIILAAGAPAALAQPATGGIQGTVSLRLCGGPVARCGEPEPVSWTFAVARPTGDLGAVELVGYVTSDARGHYEADFGPGRFTLVSKYAITHDADGAVLFPTVAPFDVAPFTVVTQDLELTGEAP